MHNCINAAEIRHFRHKRMHNRSNFPQGLYPLNVPIPTVISGDELDSEAPSEDGKKSLFVCIQEDYEIVFEKGKLMTKFVNIAIMN